MAFGHPRGWVEAEELRHHFPVAAFLAAILVVAEVCAREGVFRVVGAMVARASRRRARRMLALTFVAAALTTTALSLDATVLWAWAPTCQTLGLL